MTFRSSFELSSGIVVQLLPYYFIGFDCCLGAFLLFAFPAFCCGHYSFEIHENGIVPWSLTGIGFIRWEKICYCRYTSGKKNNIVIVRHRYFGNRRFWVRDFHVATAVLGKFVEVRDKAGKVIAAPADDRSPEQAGNSSRKMTARFFPFQFDLTTIILLMLVVASASSWYGYHQARFRPQMDAVGRLSQYRPYVFYRDADVQSLDFDPANKPPGDEDLAVFESLPEIKMIGVHGPFITDAGLVHLRSAFQLRYLNLSNTAITGAGLINLKPLTQLKSLSLYGSRISDASLDQLEPLSRLEYLNLGKTNMTDSGLKLLAQFSQLKDLELEGTKITDAGLARLTALPQLRTLNLSGTNISDVGVEHLKKLQLDSLDISGTRITQKGFDVLRHELPANVAIQFTPPSPPRAPSPSTGDFKSKRQEENDPP